MNIDEIEEQKIIRWSTLSSTEKKLYLPRQMWEEEGFFPKETAKIKKFLINDKLVKMYSAHDVERKVADDSQS